MKKQFKKMFALLLAGTMVLTSFTGCGKESKEKGSEVTDAAAVDEGAASTKESEMKEVSTLPEKLDNPDITILWHTPKEFYDTNKEKDPNSFDAVWSVIPEFEKKYGGKVTVKAVGWGEMKDTLINMVNAGESCDLAQAHDQNFPIYPVKKLIQPISKYIDVNDEFWYDGITNAFTYGGESYAVGNDATPILLYYNKTLFESNGVKSPGEYYAEGNWTWDTFKEAAINMTGDTDGDSKNDQFGFGWWDGDYSVFMNTNGTTIMNYKADGTIGTNYNTENAKEAIQFIQDAYLKDKYIDVSKKGDYFMKEFKNGKLAMSLEYGFNGYNTYACDYEVDFVPLPVGPKGEKDKAAGGLTGWCVPVTATNGDGAAAFARMSCEMFSDHINKINAEKYGQDKVDLFNKLAQNVVFAPIGVDKYWDANGTIVKGIREGTPISTFLKKADEQIAEGIKITMEQ